MCDEDKGRWIIIMKASGRISNIVCEERIYRKMMLKSEKEIKEISKQESIYQYSVMETVSVPQWIYGELDIYMFNTYLFNESVKKRKKVQGIKSWLRIIISLETFLKTFMNILF